MDQPKEPIKKPVLTAKQLKTKEINKHYDSHVHLSSMNDVACRPIIVDAPVTLKDDLLIDSTMTGIVAAVADETAILIVDSNALFDVTAKGSRIQYVVNASVMKASFVEKGKDDQYPRHYIHVDTVDEALADIREKMMQVSAKADPKNPWDLPTELWTYMATREIRIVGSFRHIAKNIEKAEVLVVHRPDVTGKGMFVSKTIGKRSFSRSNIALVLKAYYHDITLAEHLIVQKQATLSPYMAKVLENLTMPDTNTTLDVDMFNHFKNEHNVYHIKDIPDEATDLLIIDYKQWKEWNVENAFVILICEHCESVALDPAVNKNPKVLAIKATKYEAIELVLGILRSMKNNPAVEFPLNLASIKNIHVFNDVISDAYAIKN